MTPPPQPALTKRDLLTGVLKHVSRSFYLTLRVLPAVLRDQLGLAYLFARAADTIADTGVLPREQRLECLQIFRGLFGNGAVPWHQVTRIQQAVLPHQSLPAERLLVERLEDCFRVFLDFSVEDQARIRSLMRNLTPGMEMDLVTFAGDRVEDLTALRSFDDLDRYIYHVAGCVGEFWTHMSCAHVASLASWNQTHMSKIGVRFGKGLQLTNVLKDLPRDLRRGRCYVPQDWLEDVGLKPGDLLRPESLPALRPVLTRLLRHALDHLDQGWLYTLAIPRREVRLRLACLWPLLFAGETLRLVASSPDLLDPAVNVKMTRGRVYRLMALTTMTAASGRLWTAYWGRLRKQIV